MVVLVPPPAPAKFVNLGPRTVAAAGNIFLGGVAFVALVLDSWLDGSGPLLDLSGVLSGGVVFFAALGWTVSSDPGYVLGALPSR